MIGVLDIRFSNFMCKSSSNGILYSKKKHKIHSKSNEENFVKIVKYNMHQKNSKEF